MRFRRWYERLESADPGVAAAGLLLYRELGDGFLPEARRHATRLLALADTSESDPFLALTAGTGLLLHDADAFRTWNEELGERLLDALDARGMVAQGRRGGGYARSTCSRLRLRTARTERPPSSEPLRATRSTHDLHGSANLEGRPRSVKPAA